MSAASALAELLAASGMTKKALCESAGISRSSLDLYLKGERQPSVEQVERLGAAAGMRLEISWRRLDIKPTPRWAGPNPQMNAPPLTGAASAPPVNT